jgi:hypothetical protein
MFDRDLVHAPRERMQPFLNVAINGLERHAWLHTGRRPTLRLECGATALTTTRRLRVTPPAYSALRKSRASGLEASPLLPSRLSRAGVPDARRANANSRMIRLSLLTSGPWWPEPAGSPRLSRGWYVGYPLKCSGHSAARDRFTPSSAVAPARLNAL